MNAPAAPRWLTAARWLLPLALVLIYSACILPLLQQPGPELPTLCFALLIASLGILAWVLYPRAGAILINLAVLLALGYAWAMERHAAFGLACAAFIALWAVAAVARRRQFRRMHRMTQHLDDLKEEVRVKEQALAQSATTQEGLQKKLSRYTQLQGVAEELSNLTDLAAIAKLAVERAFTLIGKSDAALLFLLDAERQELSLFASQKREDQRAIQTKHGDQFDQHVLRSHKPLLVSDVRRDFRFTASAGADRRISSVVACPLLIGQSPAGVLRLDTSAAGAYTQDDLRFLDILLDLVATAMTNAKLFEQVQRLAMTDGLTGLMLRRPFLEQLTRELTRAARAREPVSVLMIDIDHFKKLNDTFGHTAGDVVLRAVAEVLRRSVRRGDAAARYGGEEFVILLPRTSRHQAVEVAEKIRRSIAADVVNPDKAGVQPVRAPEGGPERRQKVQTLPEPQAESPPITVSIGLASFPDDAKVELELIRIADSRLYQAKRAGRNQVCAS